MAIKDYVSAMTLKVNYDGSPAEQGLSSLKKLIAGAFTIYAAKQVFDYSVGLAKVGMAANAAESSFRRMVGSLGGDADKMVADMKRATMNTIDDSDLMSMAFDALLKRINFKDIKVAMEYATRYSLNTGKNFNEVYEQIMTSFYRNTDRGLKTLGINVGGAKDVVKAAVEIMQSKMKDLAVDIDDPILKQQQLKAQWQGIKEQIGKDLVPAYSSLLDVLGALSKTVGILSGAWVGLATSMGTALNTNIPKQTVDIKTLSNATLESLNREAEARLRTGQYTKEQAQAVSLIIAARERELELRKKIIAKHPGALDEKTGLPTTGIVAPSEDKTSSFKKQMTIEELNAIKDIQKRASEEAAVTAEEKIAILTKQYQEEKVLLTQAGESTLILTRAYNQKVIEIQQEMYTKADSSQKQALQDALEVYKRSETDAANTAEEKIMILTKQYNSEKTFLELSGMNTVNLTNVYNNKILAIHQEFEAKLQEEQDKIMMEEDDKRRAIYEIQRRVYVDEMSKTLEGKLQLLREDYENEYNFLYANGESTLDLTKQYEENKSKIYEEEAQKRVAIAQEWIGTVSNLTNDLQTLSDARTAREIRNLDKLHLSDREYAKRKAAIEEKSLESHRKYARIEQGIAVAQAIVATYEAGTKALAAKSSLGVIAGIIEMGIAISAGLIQVATIQAQNFSTGRGLVDILSNGRNADTIPARIGKGEYIMPADKTAQNIDQLEDMRKGTVTRGNNTVITQNFYSVPLETMIQVQRDMQRKNLTTQRI
jgi:hypothetical protein